jgi:hypothetical protein
VRQPTAGSTVDTKGARLAGIVVLAAAAPEFGECSMKPVQFKPVYLAYLLLLLIVILLLIAALRPAEALMLFKDGVTIPISS